MTVAATCYMASDLSGERAGSSVMASRHSYLHWLPLKAPSPTFKVMIVNNELYAQMMGVILKGRAFEVVRFDKEDAMLTKLSEARVQAGFNVTTVLSADLREH